MPCPNDVQVHVCALSASPHAVHVIIENDYNYLILILILIIINVHVHVCCGKIFVRFCIHEDIIHVHVYLFITKSVTLCFKNSA